MTLRKDLEMARDTKGKYNSEQFMVDEISQENYEDMAMNIDGTISFLMELEHESNGNITDT